MCVHFKYVCMSARILVNPYVSAVSLSVCLFVRVCVYINPTTLVTLVILLGPFLLFLRTLRPLTPQLPHPRLKHLDLPDDVAPWRRTLTRVDVSGLF